MPKIEALDTFVEAPKSGSKGATATQKAMDELVRTIVKGGKTVAITPETNENQRSIQAGVLHAADRLNNNSDGMFYEVKAWFGKNDALGQHDGKVMVSAKVRPATEEEIAERKAKAGAQAEAEAANGAQASEPETDPETPDPEASEPETAPEPEAPVPSGTKSK